jgi:hypothetical protein
MGRQLREKMQGEPLTVQGPWFGKLVTNEGIFQVVIHQYQSEVFL